MSNSPWGRKKRDPQPDPELTPLTHKEELAAAAHLAGAPIEEVAHVANMTVAQAQYALKKPVVKAYLATYLDEAGASLKKSAKVIAEAHNATEKKFFAFEGRVRDEREVVDHKTRMDAATLNLKARGELKEGVNVNFNMYQDLSDEEVAAIAAGLATPGDFTGQGAR